MQKKNCNFNEISMRHNGTKRIRNTSLKLCLSWHVCILNTKDLWLDLRRKESTMNFSLLIPTLFLKKIFEREDEEFKRWPPRKRHQEKVEDDWRTKGKRNMLMRVDHYNFLYTAHQNLERENIKDRSPIFYLKFMICLPGTWPWILKAKTKTSYKVHTSTGNRI
jgi:hypothetical protein